MKAGLLFDSNGDWFVDQSIPYTVRLAFSFTSPLPLFVNFVSLKTLHRVINQYM